jgi:hypothetical protein
MSASGALKPFLLAVTIIGFGLYPAQAKDKDEETCCQPGRIESAKAIIAQADTFKMKASQFHTDSAALIRDAAKLRGQAGKIDPNARKTYEADLAAFKAHADAYHAHQEQVEKTIGFCKTAQAEYEQMLKQYSLHTGVFHQPEFANIPNIRPPHVCKRMDMSAEDAARMNNQMRIDQQRVDQSEADLQNAEAKLATAATHNAAADEPLLAKSKVLDAERQLTGEFAALKTEYDLLHTQHDALSAAGVLKAPALTKVSGTIKSK